MIEGLFEGLDKKGVSPVIAIVLLLMMTVAAAGAAYFWLTTMQSRMQEKSTESIENIMQKSGRRLMAQAAICEPTTPDGMVAWYEFYEGEGNKTHDSSKNENTGTINGANWTDGKAGKASDFDGSHDQVSIPHHSMLQREDISIVVWAKRPESLPKSYSTTIRGIVSKGYKNPYTVGWVSGTDNPPNSKIFAEFELTGGDVGVHDDDGFPANEWTHIVATFENSSSTGRLFVNGQLKDTDTGDDTPLLTSTDPVHIGYAEGSRWYPGTIDEPRIYDRALSAEEINETYKGKMKVKVTVRNIGSVSIPEAEFVANLKKDGTTVDSDTYTTTSSIDTGDLKTLTFYFNEMRPGGEGYTISIPGIDVSQTVNCQSLE